MPRKGDWIMTYSGGQFWPMDPKKEEIYITDIAHALSQLNRFCGHTDFPWSVAQHSIAMSYVVPPEHALACLLHDASEAYMADVPRPLKRSLLEYTTAENQLLHVISNMYKVNVTHFEVKHADLKALVTEASVLFKGRSAWWLDPLVYPEPYNLSEFWVEEIPWRDVKDRFLRRFRELSIS